MTTTSTFHDLGDSRTEVRIHQANVPEAFRSPQAQAGFASSLDKFAGYLQSLTADARRRLRWLRPVRSPMAASTTDTQLRELIAAERRELAAVLSGLPEQSWNAPTLCAGLAGA